MDKDKTLNVAIVGGGPGCKAIVDMIFSEKLSQLRMNLIGVADNDPNSVGYCYAKEKGIYTTKDYHNLYKLKDLNMIIELTGRDEVLNDIFQTKPGHIRLMGHVAARLFWDVFQIEEKMIADQEQGARALLESETKYETLVENSLTGIYIDLDGKLAFANNKLAEIYGYSRNELIGMETWRLVHPEDRAMTDSIRAKRLKGEGAPSGYEARGIKKDGEIIWIARRNTAIEYKGMRAILGNIVDITERKRAKEALQRARDELEIRVKERTSELMVVNEQLLREIEDRKRAEKEVKASEEKYHLLFNYDPNPLVMVDVQSTRILDVNNQASVVYQYSRDEFLGMSFLDLFDPEDANRLWEELGRFSKDEYIFLAKIMARKKDGSPFFVNFYAGVGKFHEVDDKAFGLSYIIRTVDITRRLEREAQLTQAGKMATLGEMATSIAHELNQPLNVIRVGTDFFSKMTKRGDKVTDEQMLKVSSNISAQVDRATNIINHLREFGRRSDFKTYPVDINEPIRDVFTIMGKQLEVRNIEVELKLDEGLPVIQADKNRLEQIFLNLVTNARDAMEAKGGKALKKLTITTFEDNSRVVALVSDTGAGISENNREKIFEPFFTTKEVGKGTGLGLSITYGLVKDFKGDIDITLTADVGTIFRVSFPVYEDEDLLNDKASDN